MVYVSEKLAKILDVTFMHPTVYKIILQPFSDKPGSFKPQSDTPLFATNATPLQLYHLPRATLVALMCDTPLFATNANPLQLYHLPRATLVALMCDTPLFATNATPLQLYHLPRATLVALMCCLIICYGGKHVL